jgi:hypothetical protein
VTQVGLIRGFLANCFVFYSLLCIVLTGIYIAQVVASRDSGSVLSESDILLK